ncbi:MULTISPECIES: heme biosynthesis HemY N-terminal domain-containing protein [unclassified Bosea (in: a-proteobacteria)]|uniref:heme biosynthesis HemY N-terminal domain-containing protein n=1 Tax=unclassified Bosea (in: a-proteobacteria) TaxID=2653178 RepID=UPI000F75152B|nr:MULTISPECIES: heme biosynthesis HemY N-terminal domain-containing protein [unclassified Bosea (in: a-proteobacteria)]AZO80843.1 heme biosynthesis protein HemY [Bosea sp. Tri-49]RXT25807.1 heme biosynthesis protein HemY [Bosea sp. Tri-39]RXT31049.1 heme biosynthesis protein HemY [Bosea sp. Tri-54]
MVRVLVYLFIIALVAVGAVWLADRPGEVSILWQGYRIETSVAIAAIGVVVLAFLTLVAWAIMRFVFGLPSAFGFASRARRRARGFEAISRGMVAIGAGDPIAAGRHAVDARKFVANEPLTLLLEAQSAQLSGDRGQAEAAFKAMLDKPETRVLGLRGLFVEARRRGDMTAARAFADDAVRRSPSLAWANDALLDFHTAAGDWQAARTAVERRAALRLADKGEAKRQRAVLLAAEALDAKDREPEKALAAALEAVKLAPGLTPAAALAGRMLSERGDIKKAARLLEAAWKQVSHPDVASAYLDVRPGDSARDRLARAETLTKLRPADPEGVLALAGAAIHAQDFARARSTLKPLLAGGASVRACLLMAELEEAEHGATGRVREWLARATRAPRDAAWVADGLVSDQWLPISPISGRLDAFVWTVPPATLGSQGAHLNDDVLADLDEPSAPLLEGKAEVAEAVTVPAPAGLAPPVTLEQPKAEAKPEPKIETKAEPPVAPTPPPAEPVVEIAPVTTKPAPQQAKPAPVVFPVAHAPDDPGPEQQAPGEAKGRFRIFS